MAHEKRLRGLNVYSLEKTQLSKGESDGLYTSGLKGTELFLQVTAWKGKFDIRK